MTSQQFAPLSLSEVQERYPNLFEEYAHLSDREKGTRENMKRMSQNMKGISENMAGIMLDPSSIDSATGLCTTIMVNNDFTKPLEESKIPLKTDSDGYRFCIFLIRCLYASESGSVGGDACRQFDILLAALRDILKTSLVSSRFEHLLAWTVAANHHRLYALLYRGDPDRNRALFKAVAAEWRKLFKRVETDTEEDVVSKELISFAEMQCKHFQSLLKQAKKEYGDYAKYNFNFKKRASPKTKGRS